MLLFCLKNVLIYNYARFILLRSDYTSVHCSSFSVVSSSRHSAWKRNYICCCCFLLGGVGVLVFLKCCISRLVLWQSSLILRSAWYTLSMRCPFSGDLTFSYTLSNYMGEENGTFPVYIVTPIIDHQCFTDLPAGIPSMTLWFILLFLKHTYIVFWA